MKNLIKYAKNYQLEILASSIGAFIYAYGYVMIIYSSFALLLNFSSITHTNIFIIAFWAIATGIGNSIEHYYGHDIAFRVLKDFRSMVFRKIRVLGPQIVDNKDSSELLNLIGKDIDNIEVFYAHTIVPLIKMCCYMVGIFIFYLKLNLLIAVTITATSIVVIYLSNILFKEEAYDLSKKYHQKNGRLHRNLHELIEGKDSIIQLNIQEKLSENINRDLTLLNALKVERQYYQDKRIRTLNTIYLVGFVLLILCLHNTIGINKLNISYLLIYPFAFEPYKSITKLQVTLSNAIVAADNMFAFLNLKTSFEENGKCIKIDVYPIEIENLDFIYPGTKELVLKNINLKIEKGEKIGIYGDSGAGKSTLVKVLMKWYPYSKGSIKIGRVELSEIKQSDVMRKISYMPQNPDFFTYSIKENLRMFDESISEDEILKVLVELNLIEKIETLENGINTILSPDNFGWSSGELQRLDLARTLLHKSEVLILDEPLSNIDNKNEFKILNYITKYYTGIVIIISHRLEAFTICDRIYQINNKNLVKKI
ncbi:ATP-binding cassette domain-containing protein [Erysipelothrix aquatica]|uniref:ATP-binding cassette domain-containing protein n=1 Tax=Erysipelothrix aquatica TaxID=2683714 RepID=UPI00135AA21C|nr:ABC transporter ATP-binding protein [Erysipelothrix aquatica]